MVTGGDAEDEALLLWSLVVEDESITESILIVHSIFVNKKKNSLSALRKSVTDR